MNEGTLGLVVFGSIVIDCAAVWHGFVKRYLAALIGATITTVIVFQVVNFLHLGYLDPFAAIAMVVSGLIALAISAVIGLPFRLLRQKPSNGPNSQSNR